MPIRKRFFIPGLSALFLLVLGGWALASWVKPVEPVKRVLMIYVDGLRPDTLDAMVTQGRLPVIRKFFYEEGRRYKNAVTIFPSNTVIANGMVMTGLWPDRSGLKTQAYFQRYRVWDKTFWEKLFRKKDRFPKHYNLLAKTDIGPKILRHHKIKALYDDLGEKYHAAVVPLSPQAAPSAWPHVAANYVDNPLQITAEAPEKIDDINGEYAMRYMTGDPRGRVYLIWFPGLDEDQHADPWGQFGKVRERVEKLDAWVGKLQDRFQRVYPKDRLYVIFFSDHGAYGGKDGIFNYPYHLSQEFFYQRLKMNVIGPDFSVQHPGTDPKSFAYADNMGRGQCRLYFPVADSLSGDWSRPNTLYELQHYGLGPNREPVNLIEEVLNIRRDDLGHFPGKVDPHPVEFVIVKLAKDLIWVKKQGGAEALIRAEKTEGRETLRYLPVRGVAQDASGKIRYEETQEQDPFGYLTHPRFHAEDRLRFLESGHDLQAWLEATYETDYPDAVPAVAKSLLWSPDLEHHAPAEDGDLQLSAMPGWNFRYEPVQGADHGALSSDSMRVPLMIHGPGISQGVEESPARLLQLAPTVFRLIGDPVPPDLDAAPLRGIFENE